MRLRSEEEVGLLCLKAWKILLLSSSALQQVKGTKLCQGKTPTELVTGSADNRLKTWHC